MDLREPRSSSPYQDSPEEAAVKDGPGRKPAGGVTFSFVEVYVHAPPAFQTRDPPPSGAAPTALGHPQPP